MVKIETEKQQLLQNSLRNGSAARCVFINIDEFDRALVVEKLRVPTREFVEGLFDGKRDREVGLFLSAFYVAIVAVAQLSKSRSRNHLWMKRTPGVPGVPRG